MIPAVPKKTPSTSGGSHDPWADREGKRRPTRERRDRGAFRLVAGEDAGVTIAFDDESTPLRSAFTRGQISQRQLDAGEAFERLVRAVIGSPGPRSCLDWGPRGGEESEPEYRARARHEFASLCRELGPSTATILLHVCYHQNGTGPRDPRRRRWRRLTEGLTVAADFWKLPPAD